MCELINTPYYTPSAISIFPFFAILLLAQLSQAQGNFKVLGHQHRTETDVVVAATADVARIEYTCIRATVAVTTT